MNMQVIAYILLSLSLTVAVVNWILLVRWYLRRKRSTLLLLVGGVLAIAGTVVHPSIQWYWGLLAVVVDPGCFSFLGLPNLVERLVTKRRAIPPSNRIER
jgi:hypothetical protein